jgi:thiamine pyrophosphokinase
MNLENKKAATGRCLIITAYIESAIADAVYIRDGDFVICVDGGYEKAAAEGIVPDLLLGDFDSLNMAIDPALREKTLRLPAEKDDTDTLAALKHGLGLGFSDFMVVGGIGGRLDHTLANLQTLSYCLDCGGRIWMADGGNKATLTDGPIFRIQKEDGFYFSLFSWSGRCSGVCIENAKYLLRDATLTQSVPVGVSNEFLDGDALIKIKQGRLLVLLSKDPPRR